MTASKKETAVAPASAAAAQLSSLGAPSTLASATTEPKFQLTDSALDTAFNDMWANNANAISHCYSNTDALKVDFTRTGKRSFLGMINDATNSVYRMVQGAVTDFFRQTVLDFIYGSIGLQGLERYYDDLNSRDPSEAVRLARVRASAIESCQREVLPNADTNAAGGGGEPKETLLGAWTLCSPIERNKIQALKLEEKVTLLTPKALYVCSYDFGKEQLNDFTKVLVGDIVSIKQGLYITSPHESSHPEDNWGFVITYLHAESRSNTTASIRNMTTTVQSNSASSSSSPEAKHIFAFRAISDESDTQIQMQMQASGSNTTIRSRHLTSSTIEKRRSQIKTKEQKKDDDEEDDSAENGECTSKQKVRRIVELLAECCADAGAFDPDDEDEASAFVTQGTIQSLEEAKSQMPYFGPLIEGLKRRLWL